MKRSNSYQLPVVSCQLRKIVVLVICLITGPLSGIANAEFQVGGYYKNFSTVFNSPFPDAPITGIVVNRLRLNLSHTPTDTLSFAVAYDFTPRVQDPLLFSQSPFAVGVASSRYRVVDFDALIYPSTDAAMGSVGIYHNLDRAAVQFSTDFADFSIGRDAIAWGSARIINPTDTIAPYTYDQLDTEDRVGIDAVRVRIPVGVMGEVDTGYILGNNFDFDKSAVFLRTQLNAAETDFSILLLEFQRDLLIGLDVARGIGGAGFWLETAYVLVEPFDDAPDASDNYLRTSVGLDYSFGGETYGFIEYHFNGAGARKPENYLANLEQSAYTRGGVYLLGRHYLAPGFTHQLTPLISFSGQMLFNLSDPSTFVAPQIAYNVAEDIHLSVGGFVSIGKRPKNGESSEFQSEFGSYPNLFFSSFRVYF
ncbi:hypothetical protein F4009_00655 [Candidatus Poribacteria bacterium]|nr:hypothetical protein [Candidatus Poribacteria bacterium]MYH83971.1 hypothetical protein [Candidatus Poribacteria bacterium]MYK92511.1 hypothetical protein [Candidatus Poribacteria bacterium]